MRNRNIAEYQKPWVKGVKEPHDVKKKYFDLSENQTHDSNLCSTICVHSAMWHSIHIYPFYTPCYYWQTFAMIDTKW